MRSFQKTGTECGATWQATGAGSVIDLPGLISLKGFSCSILGGVKIQANSGGFVNLRNLVTVSNNYVSVLADGADSLIDLSGLLNFPEPPSFSLTNRSGGIVDVSGAMASIPLEPLLLSPPNNSANATLIVRLEWQAASNVVAFEYELAQNNAVIVQGSGLSGVTVPLPAHGIYQWRVRGKTAHRFSPWSQTWTFDTLPGIGVPTLLAPDEQAAQVPVFASLQWSPVAGAVAYDYELTRGSLSQTASVRGTENTAVRLLPDTAYAWRVRAKSLYRQGNWSPARAFRTVSTNGAALALSLIPPAQPGSGIIRLNWPAIPGNTYWLQYKHVLEDPVWTDVQQVVPAGDRLTADALVGTNDTAFFRVVQRDGLHLLSATADQDHDRMEDGWERANGLNPADPSDANTDLDHDGLTNLDEFELGSSPNVADNAGSLPGQFAVASGGAATYEIPIAVPPGTAGMIPKLALTSVRTASSSRAKASSCSRLSGGWVVEGMDGK